MKVDYSKFGREFEWENWFGEVDINDGDRVNTVSVEISQGEDNEIPEELKKKLEFFIENYHRYKEVLSDPIFKYYKSKERFLKNDSGINKTINFVDKLYFDSGI